MQGAGSEALNREVLVSARQEKPRTVPPPGDGQKIFQIDPMLQGYKYHLEYRSVLLASFNSTAHFKMFQSFTRYRMPPSTLECHDALYFILIVSYGVVTLQSFAGRSYCSMNQ